MASAAPEHPRLEGQVLCGYQGWFRAPGDASGFGWTHWSRDGKRVAPETVTFEMWPELAEYPLEERYATPEFTGADGQPMALFSSDNAGTVLRHFQWMEQYGIDGVWFQHFAVELPGAKGGEKRYPSRRRVLEHVRQAAQATKRAWAITFDLTGLPAEQAVDIVAAEWQQLVAQGVPRDAQYIHEQGKPVVQIFGLYPNDAHNPMTPAAATRLIKSLKAEGPGQAYVVGGGAWHWRKNTDAEWQAMYAQLDGISPWNVANYSKDKEGVMHATVNYWKDDQALCASRGQMWIPVIYPGFAWSNLKQLPPGTGEIPRRGGAFLWEQFQKVQELGAKSVCVAMFDEVDEGTAILKVTNTPPQQGHFLTYEGLPSDWYLRLVGEGTKRLRSGEAMGTPMPIGASPR